MTDTFVAMWPVTDSSVKLPGLVLLAEPDLMLMLDEQEVTLTAQPQWTLRGDRLVATAPARRRVPWDHPDSAKAYLLDLMPDGVNE